MSESVSGKNISRRWRRWDNILEFFWHYD
jgi:hypothetical protein